MILHLIFDDKFIDYAIKQFEPYGNSQFVLIKTHESHQIRYISLLDKVKIVLYHSPEYAAFLHDLGRFSAIILHGLYTFWQAEIVMSAPQKVKVCWAFWGGDKYNRADIRDSYLSPATKILSRSHDLLKRKKKYSYEVPLEVMQRVDYLLDDSYENYLDVKEYIRKPTLKHLWYTYYSIEETIGKELLNAKVSGTNILVGHSANLRTNHLAGFKAVKRLHLGNRDIVSVLVYGDAWYGRLIKKIGRLMFGKHFKAVTDFVPKEQYNKLLLSCPIVVMSTYKPEGMGNCLAALWLGARLYMFRRNLKYQYFKRIGLKVFTIEDDLNDNNPDAFLPISDADLQHNREILQREYGFKEMDERIKKLINELEK